MSLFQLGDFTLNSGAKSKWKLECDALTDDDWKALAAMIRDIIRPFSSVEGVPSGGLKLAECLKPYCSLTGPHLIVDDVLTTGGSMQRLWDEHMAGIPDGKTEKGRRAVAPAIGAVVFARGQCPLWVQPLFQMPESLWIKPRMR